MTKTQKIVYYILLVIVSASFIMASVSKLTSQPAAVAGFVTAHLPIWFMYFIGIAELAGVIGLWMRSCCLRVWAASGLLVILAGAVVTTAIYMNVVEALFPLVVAILLVIVMQLGKKMGNCGSKNGTTTNPPASSIPPVS